MYDAQDELLDSPEFRQRLASRDRQAVNQLALECAGPIHDYLKKTRRRHGVGQADWPDIVQTILAKFIVEPPELDPARPIMPYLKRMALNAARDLSRAAGVRMEHEEALRYVRPKRVAGGERFTSSHALDDVEFVTKVLGTMSDQDQCALRAYQEAGPNGHIVLLAEREDITRGAAQMRFVRATKRWDVAVQKALRNETLS